MRRPTMPCATAARSRPAKRCWSSARPAAWASPRLRLQRRLALLKGASVVGVFWGDFARREPKGFAESFQQLARWYGEGRLRPHVSQTLLLERAAEAIQLLASRRAKGKIVLTTAA